MRCSRRNLLALSTLVVAAGSAAAGVLVMPPPGPVRVAQSDAVIVGKVVALEPQDVQVMNTTYRVAVVQVEEALRGARGDKTLRVGFVPPPPNAVGGRPVIITGSRGVQLQLGLEGLFLLKKHPKENFYTFGGPAGWFVGKQNNPSFEKDVKAARASVTLLDNPQAGLASKDADERLLAAAILIDRYRTAKGATDRQEAIPAEESKQILQALADADWKGATGGLMFRPNPMLLFNRLGIGASDGWSPAPGSNVQAAMQTWLRDHAATYRIRRYVHPGDGKDR